ncbi:hypothetical protein N8J89_30235 [Crossiella sp. CA-258035]|uniref:hypothetical protein n=1 Tax=Crossiella sp. CA-258035 TaxID=2981138 RepID=UPI0024BC7A4B|nr:hypothetical protein [Crossiella sp. CA-258035]WHT17383.1 hypothetical protein N8J89_30235 [Crossiella sp. CA-258035]
MTRVLVLAVAAVFAALTACSSGETPKDNPAPPVPAPATSTSPSSAAPPKPLAKDCADVLTAADVETALGKTNGGTGVRSVVGVPEPKIGRTGRLGCYYVPPRDAPAGQAGSALVELGLATYADEAAALKRVRATVETERGKGAAVNDVQVGSDKAVLVVAEKQRTLVYAVGRSTIALTLPSGVVPDDRAGPALAGLAAKVAAAAPR